MSRTLPAVLAGTAMAALGFATRTAVDPWLGDIQPFAPGFVMVAAAVALFGVRAATVTAVLCYAWGAYFFLPPRGQLSFNRLQDIASVTVNLLSSAAIIYIGHRARLATAYAERFRVVQEDTLSSFVILDAVRNAQGEIVDFVFSFVNKAAETGLHRSASDLRGRRLLVEYPGHRAVLFPLYCRVIETGAAQEFEDEYVADGVSGVFRNVVVKLGDGVAVTSLDVTELRRANRELQERDALKDQFLAVLAHELRNPLAPLRSGLEVLRLRGDEPAAVARVRPVLERQVGQLVRLVDDLLDVARISTGRIQLQRGPVRVQDIVERSVEAIRPAAESAGVTLSVSAPSPEITVNADAARLVQVLGNVLQNAVKFTPMGGAIAVTTTVQETPAAVRIAIRDTGPGIPPDLQPRIFDMFVQGTQGGGLGIGLALARRIVEMHDGTITAESGAPGTGSTFTIELPRVPEAAAAGPPGGDVTSADALRVLVVDDNVDATEMMAEVLATTGARVYTAHSGEDGVRIAREVEPQVALLDLGMPGMDGYEVCRRLRALPGGPAMQIVAVSGWGTAQDRSRALAQGFDDHLTKPVSLPALAALLDRRQRATAVHP